MALMLLSCSRCRLAAAEKGAGWTTLRVLVDPDRPGLPWLIAAGARRTALVDDDRAGAAVDDHPRRRFPPGDVEHLDRAP